VVSPNTLTDGVPKVPEGCSRDFCHFWHLVTLGFSKNTRTLRLLLFARITSAVTVKKPVKCSIFRAQTISSSTCDMKVQEKTRNEEFGGTPCK
jgi:hypothetical protein